MKKRFITLKDFEITPNENVIEWNPNFYSCIDKMKQFGCKSYRGKVEWLFKCQNICRKRICQPIPAIVNFTNKNGFDILIETIETYYCEVKKSILLLV